MKSSIFDCSDSATKGERPWLRLKAAKTLKHPQRQVVKLTKGEFLPIQVLQYVQLSRIQLRDLKKPGAGQKKGLAPQHGD